MKGRIIFRNVGIQLLRIFLVLSRSLPLLKCFKVEIHEYLYQIFMRTWFNFLSLFTSRIKTNFFPKLVFNYQQKLLSMFKVFGILWFLEFIKTIS